MNATTIKMVLQKETKIGMTWGQAMASLTLLGSIVGLYVSLNARITVNETKIETLERARIEDGIRAEKTRTENREDHARIMEKLDKLFFERAD